MRRRKWIWLLAIGCGTAALAADTPYDSIVARNAFGLRPAPLIQSAPSPQTVWTPPPDLKITGLIAVPPTRKVSFYVIEHGKPPKSYVLAEGEQQDDIKVVTIDAGSQTVRVKNQGVYVILDFKTHGLSPSTDTIAANPGTAR
jgi:hypothetical protein